MEFMECFSCGHEAMEPPYIFDLDQLLGGRVVCRVCPAEATTTRFLESAVKMLCEKAGITGPEIYAEAIKDE